MWLAVCDYIADVNKACADAGDWSYEDRHAINRHLQYKMDVVDMEHMAANQVPASEPIVARPTPEAIPAQILELADHTAKIHDINKPGDVLVYLDTMRDHLADNPAVLKQILEFVAKHAEVKYQDKTWAESVVNTIQDKIKDIRGSLDSRLTQGELLSAND